MTGQKPSSELERAGTRNPTTAALWARPLWRVIRALSVIVPVVLVTVLPADVRAEDIFKSLQKALAPQPSSKSGQSPQQPQRTQPASSGGSVGPAKEYSQADLTANGMDIMGVKLGMSPDQVIAVLQAKNMSLTQTKMVFQYPRATKDVGANKTDPYEYPALKLSARDPRAVPAGADVITIDFTPEETPRVYHVRRGVQPGAGNLLYAPWEKAVMEKYGQPTSGGETKGSHGFAGGTFMWAKGPAAETCGNGGSFAFPNIEQVVKTPADAVDKCGPWILWIRANGPDPYLQQYEVKLTGYAILDSVTRATWARVSNHTQAREAADFQHAQELSNKKPDL
jgi:hypothetical protein